MKDIVRLSLLAIALLVLGCKERTEQVDSGGILLEVEFAADGIPVRVSMNSEAAVAGMVQVPTTNIISIVADPTGDVSSLMDVDLEAVEVTYERVDSGTRVPQPYVLNLLGRITVGATLTYQNLPVMSADQLENPPLSDLLYENGGFDKETGDTMIRMNLYLRVFGRTLTGRAVESVPRPHTIEFVQ
ncbi:MAG: hypothetical protein GY856_44930 [bacterium]|nr:hypothetical protein [bacterium]